MEHIENAIRKQIERIVRERCQLQYRQDCPEAIYEYARLGGQVQGLNIALCVIEKSKETELEPIY